MAEYFEPSLLAGTRERSRTTYFYFLIVDMFETLQINCIPAAYIVIRGSCKAGTSDCILMECKEQQHPRCCETEESYSFPHLNNLIEAGAETLADRVASQCQM